MKNIALWIAQVLLAFAFVTSGRINAFAHDQAYPNMNWVQILPSGLVTFIGICELLGAAGVILPWLTGIKPRLTPLAAVGLGIVMILAMVFHLIYGERSVMISNAILLSLSAFVARGRWRS
jgi:uncharacterized membrane protein YphA (DoxX/SURF4 family)